MYYKSQYIDFSVENNFFAKMTHFKAKLTMVQNFS